MIIDDMQKMTNDAIIKELQDRWLDGMTYDHYCQIIAHTFVKGKKLKLMRYKARKYLDAELKLKASREN